uniref:tRNA-(Ms[2]io[6]A)-hydroxylase n=1 Tax=Candidatus Kentrum sp. TUN TaxID=2126343 RepID=A0A450ZWG7_9GAMM|nr:MAG: tRNA-(ms[2]io[6]A)-hydroxylase [Candidatus Kentron sp. TUN]VFK60859.1 MAG: tRNA-(ms[2]io[6]A)-hydroxylase [Candidatus Kentron sp. TUN]VFK67127.1 MAG: tRNA-(ms[2]io[6]A)-hydroxylase [Candidatus Kentron sp. TUN]
MARKSIDLLADTDPGWVAGIKGNFDAFLADHANCERKASALAMSLIVKYPDRVAIIPRLIALAQEELEHFQEVYALMEKRGLQIVRDTRDPYVEQLLELLRHGRDERFLDRLCVASLIECRGAERFRIISEALDDPALKAFYRDLWASEAKHGNLFATFALEYFDADTVYTRLEEMANEEAGIIGKLAWRPALH